MIYGVSKTKPRGNCFQKLEKYMKMNIYEIMCPYCLKKVHDKRICHVLKIWKDEKPFRTNQ